jgi:hypothetical protein
VQQHAPDVVDRDFLGTEPDAEQAKQDEDSDGGREAQRASRPVWRASRPGDAFGVWSHHASGWYQI